MVGGAARRYLEPQLLEDAEWLRVVARRLDVSSSIVNRLWRSYQETGERTRRQSQGDSPVTTPRQNVFHVLLPCRNRMSTARALEIHFHRATEVQLPYQTVRYKLHYDESQTTYRGQFPTAQHRAV